MVSTFFKNVAQKMTLIQRARPSAYQRASNCVSFRLTSQLDRAVKSRQVFVAAFCPVKATAAATGFMLSTIDVGIKIVVPRSLVVS
jgi:hypothetical protein